MAVGEVTITLVAERLPNVTVAPGWKLAPWTITVVPPARGPESGWTWLALGGGAASTCTVAVAVAWKPALSVAVAASVITASNGASAGTVKENAGFTGVDVAKERESLTSRPPPVALKLTCESPTLSVA